ncbi:MAG: CDP-alcohol phosphatidyltransferase family protein [Deltaproteobacteria bacterium]|nr:CDP-alcohol phosphatidyltransferase family protein [Deltaproteobacteria bacterium]
MIRWVPNAITVSRGLAGPVVAALLLAGPYNFLGFWIFVGAIATDLVDGFVARWLDARTALGEKLDPLADKALTVPVWVALGLVGFAPAWLCAAAVGRNLAVVGAWLALGRTEVSVAPSRTGQVMVAFEGVALSVLVFHGPWNGTHWPSVGTALGVISLALSGASLALYAASHPLLAVRRPAPVTRG